MVIIDHPEEFLRKNRGGECVAWAEARKEFIGGIFFFWSFYKESEGGCEDNNFQAT